jgi:hypothetical protein
MKMEDQCHTLQVNEDHVRLERTLHEILRRSGIFREGSHACYGTFRQLCMSLSWRCRDEMQGWTREPGLDRTPCLEQFRIGICA